MVLDFDHDPGRGLDPDAGAVRCANCHRRVTARRMDAGAKLRPVPRNAFEREMTAMRARAVSLEAEAAGLRKRADDMERALFALDAWYPNWRSLPGIEL